MTLAVAALLAPREPDVGFGQPVLPPNIQRMQVFVADAIERVRSDIAEHRGGGTPKNSPQRDY